MKVSEYDEDGTACRYRGALDGLIESRQGALSRILRVGKGHKPVIARDSRWLRVLWARLFAGKPEISLLSPVELFG
jgi:hypothetical protein